MILKQFQKVFDIDTQIGKMHEELFSLYQERANIVNPNRATPPAIPAIDEKLESSIGQEGTTPKKIWAMREYERLVGNWQIYNIHLPKYPKLETKLLAAYDILTTISALLPELYGKLGLLAVPPRKELDFPASPKFGLSKLNLRVSLILLPPLARVRPTFGHYVTLTRLNRFLDGTPTHFRLLNWVIKYLV